MPTEFKMHVFGLANMSFQVPKKKSATIFGKARDLRFSGNRYKESSSPTMTAQMKSLQSVQPKINVLLSLTVPANCNLILSVEGNRYSSLKGKILAQKAIQLLNKSIGLQRSVNKKHLLLFQSENSVIKFLRRGVDGLPRNKEQVFNNVF